MDAVNDRVIRDAGTPESAWLPWLAAQDFKAVSLQTLCPTGSRLVVVAPHPDDEILACGGLLASAAQEGIPVHVIAVTNGEASHGQDTLSSFQLGTRRAEESDAGLRALGVHSSSVTRLGIADGDVAAHIPALSRKLQTLLQAHDVVITTWELDGHPDHEATGAATAQACAAVGCTAIQAPVWMWHWSKPGDCRVPWGDLAVFDIRGTSLLLKNIALKTHKSQLEDRSETLGPVLVPSIVDRAARPCEYFFAKATADV